MVRSRLIALCATYRGNFYNLVFRRFKLKVECKCLKLLLAVGKKSDSYHAAWSERSVALLDMFRKVNPDLQAASFTEYGCGPNHPFSEALGHDQDCKRYDIKAWDEECRVVDLNNPMFEVERSDVAVLSGVLEYMNKPGATLNRLGKFHKYLLVSYYPVRSYEFLQRWRVSEIKKRVEKSGWRNHLTFDELLSVMSEHGFPVSVGWHGRQVLIALEFHEW